VTSMAVPMILCGTLFHSVVTNVITHVITRVAVGRPAKQLHVPVIKLDPVDTSNGRLRSLDAHLAHLGITVS
jgi:hypothetical protein